MTNIYSRKSTTKSHRGNFYSLIEKNAYSDLFGNDPFFEQKS